MNSYYICKTCNSIYEENNEDTKIILDHSIDKLCTCTLLFKLTEINNEFVNIGIMTGYKKTGPTKAIKNFCKSNKSLQLIDSELAIILYGTKRTS